MPTDAAARRRRRVAVVVVSAVVALLCAAVNSGVIGGVPPKPRLHHLQIAAATGHLYADLPAPTPSLPLRRADPPEDLQTLVKRAELAGRILVSAPVLERIAARCGVASEELSGLGRTTANVPIALTEPDSERRASDIEASKAPYRIEVQGRPTLPVLDVYAQAPTVAGATCLADAAAPALTDFLHALARQQHSPDPVLALRQLGAARGGLVDGGATVTIAMLTFMSTFGVVAAVLFGAEWLVRRRRAWTPEVAVVADVAVRPLRAAREAAEAVDPPEEADPWPHTNRLLPWMVAAFIAVLWLTPFNNIALNASLPIELRLDRLVLPVVALTWLVAAAAGGRMAPRLRLTWVHVALGGLLACAFLSVVTDARYLNQSLELELSLKKLPLMVSYVSFFLIAASAVRPGEIRAFLTFTLVLSVICALGMIWEYRMQQNIFWDWSDKLLPGFFSINGALAGGAVDHLGRPVVRGPAEVPLEAVAMLTMALPIALVRILQVQRWRQRILYGLAVCALVAATFATYRKSALVAPVSVVLTLAYFRRRELLRLAPLGMVLLALVSVISPGALGSTVRQFTRSDAANVPTVSDRTSDYDAVRPDVWSHLALGRGWGSYNHDSYRILDSEILSRTIETGVLGLAAFVLTGVAAVGSSRKTIASRDPDSAPVALVGASIGVAFLVLATLFDELSFPHATYIFLYLAGLVTVVLRRPREAADERPPQVQEPRDSPLHPTAAPAAVAQVPVAPVR